MLETTRDQEDDLPGVLSFIVKYSWSILLQPELIILGVLLHSDLVHTYIGGTPLSTYWPWQLCLPTGLIGQQLAVGAGPLF